MPDHEELPPRHRKKKGRAKPWNLEWLYRGEWRASWRKYEQLRGARRAAQVLQRRRATMYYKNEGERRRPRYSFVLPEAFRIRNVKTGELVCV